MDTEFLFQMMGKVLEMNSWLHNKLNVFSTTELYSFKLRWYILCIFYSVIKERVRENPKTRIHPLKLL